MRMYTHTHIKYAESDQIICRKENLFPMFLPINHHKIYYLLPQWELPQILTTSRDG